MAKHSTSLKRVPIKWIRDKSKANYKKGPICEICGVSEDLDFHHYYTLTPLFEKWLKTKKITVTSDEDVLAVRDEFISLHTAELYEHTVTLCHMHHMKLHGVYGKDPALTTATKQMNWVKIQKEKYEAQKLATGEG